MKTIKFFHQDETLVYNIEKCFCKVVLSGQQHQLLIEIHSTDELDHVEGDAIQNNFPQVSLYVEDFPVSFKSTDELNQKIIEIPFCFNETEDEDGEIEEFYYTSVNVQEDDYEADNNTLSFFKNNNGKLCLKWKGEVQDFIDESDEYIPFELECMFSDFTFDERD